MDRVENAVVSYCRYLGKLFCPVDLAVYYPYPDRWPATIVCSACLVLLVVSVFAIALRRNHPYLLVGWFWFIGTLAPVIGLVQVGLQAMADRYTYVPSLGIFMMLAWGIHDLSSRWRGKATIRSDRSHIRTAQLAVGKPRDHGNTHCIPRG